MYDGFSDKCAYYAEWFEVEKNSLELAFADDRRKKSVRAIGVRTEGCYLSMRCLVTLLSMDLCRTT
jgi:hypothetical protein